MKTRKNLSYHSLTLTVCKNVVKLFVSLALLLLNCETLKKLNAKATTVYCHASSPC